MVRVERCEWERIGVGRLGIPRELLANNLLQRGSLGLAACGILGAEKATHLDEK
jgi:hypothetical protein